MEKLTGNEMEISKMEANKIASLRDRELGDKSVILKILKSNVDFFSENKVRSIDNLYKEIRNNNEFLGKLKKDESKIIHSFYDLSKLFPPKIADALVSSGITSRSKLKNLSDKKFTNALLDYGVDKELITRNGRVFKEISKARLDKDDIKGANEINLIIKNLDKDQKAELKNIGIESFYDWALVRPTDLSSQLTKKIDAYARLSQLNLSVDESQKLIDQENIRSVSQIAQLSEKELISLSDKTGLKKGAVFALADKARKKNDINKTILYAMKDPTKVNDLIDMDRDWLDDFEIDLGDLIKECVECSSDLSVFSCFAYLIYLIQLTGKSLNELSKTLDLDFTGLNADNLNEISDNPQIACEKITVCEQMTRSLQDYLDVLRNNSKFDFDYERYAYLDFQVWKANKMALQYPELNALWRGDVLTGEIGSLSNGSFLKDPSNTHAHLADQLDSVRSTLEDARIFSYDGNQDVILQQISLSPNDFDNAKLFREAHRDHFTDFSNGIEVIEQILSADQKILEAHESLQVDDAGNSIAHLSAAAAHLDRVAELTFDSLSTWRNTSGQDNQSLIDLRPEQRAEVSRKLFSELTQETKPLFTPRNSDILIQGLPNDGSISLDSSWTNVGAFRDSNGNLEKYSPSNTDSFVKYQGSPQEDFSRFTNYSLSADLVLDKLMESGDVIALATHWETNSDTRFPKTGYMLAITQETDEAQEEGIVEQIVEFIFGDDDVITKRQFLTIQKITEDQNGNIDFKIIGTPQQIGFLSQGDGALNSTDQDNGLMKLDRIYPMKISIVGSKISGELRVSESKKVNVEANDNSFPSGTFGFFGSEQTQFTLSDIKFDLEGANEGFPPFHARRRLNNRNRLNDQTYVDHRDQGSGMSIDNLAEMELTSTSSQFVLKPLAGLRKIGSNSHFLALMFGRQAKYIKLNILDDLLEHCLSAAFYMRYAVIPIKMAEAFALQGNYIQSIDYLKLVYDDFSKNESQRSIYPFLKGFTNVFKDIPGADAKLMRLRLGDSYLKQADILFRQNTSKSKYEAKQLFEKVLALHNETDRCKCDASIGEVTEKVLRNIFDSDDLVIKNNIARLLGLIKLNYQRAIPVDVARIIKNNFKQGMKQEEFDKAIVTSQNEINEAESKYHKALKKQSTIEKMTTKSKRLVDEIEVRIPSINSKSTPDKNFNYQALYNNYLGFKHIAIPLVSYLDLSFCIPQNPMVLQQTKQACLMLDLIENCLNVLGYAQDFIPTQRFTHLLSLANSFSDSAYSVERDVLNFRRLLEDEVQKFINAENNVALSNANAGLESLNIEHALGEVTLSELQKSQTQFSFNHFEQLIADGLSGYENLALMSAGAATVFSGVAAAGGMLSAGATAVGIGSSASGNPAGIALAAAGIAGTLLGGAQGLASFSNNVSNWASMQAGFERREQEWQYNLGLNAIGVDIANQNIQQALKRLDIVQRQYEIAEMKIDFAQNTLSFLENKFFNKEMLTWLLRISRDQYRLRLNYAIATAYMAERALAFELSSPSLKAIRFDYFEPVRDGLLGATQLQTDLKTLQITKLNTEKRKLQLSKTISLAELAPSELQQFKTTGMLPFSTLQNWFDRDFPGHYQRLIKKVSVSMLALVPPHKGIRAMLRNNGLSKVVTGPPYSDVFEEKTVTRFPESIALSSAFDSTGLINLEYQSEFLLPFEGLGVETDWLLEMPKASNAFDYNTIADVFIRIDYVAMHSDIYAEQVREALGNSDSADIPILPRLQYPDAWYHFINDPLDANSQGKLSINVPDEFIPHHFDQTQSAQTKHVTLMVQGEFTAAQKTQLQKAITVEHVYPDTQNAGNNLTLDLSNVPVVAGTVNPPAAFKTNTFNVDSQSLLLSTRDNNNIAVTLSSNIDPLGQWNVFVKDDIAGMDLIKSITDVLIVISIEGKVDWN